MNYFLRYESKGKQFQKNQPKHPVGFSPEYIAERKAKKDSEVSNASDPPKKNVIPGLAAPADSQKSKKKKKNKSQQQVNAVTETVAKITIIEPEGFVKQQKQSSSQQNSNHQAAKNPGKSKVIEDNNLELEQSKIDAAKRLKNLKKKIKEIEAHEEKIKAGQIKKPEKEVLEKLSRKAEILREIKQIERHL